MSMATSPASATVRRHFHWCLAAVVLPVVTLPLEWAAALGHRRRTATAEYRHWSRWLLALAIGDTIVAGLVIALVASGVWSFQTLTERPLPAAGGDGVRVGATIASHPQRPNEAQVTSVAADSPAERAGLRVGDVLIAVDGVGIRNVTDAIGSIRAGEPGVPRTLRVRRDGRAMEIVVTPERRAAIADAEPTSTTPPQPCSPDVVPYVSAVLRWRGLWAAAVMMLGLWLMSRRRHGRAPPLWSWVAAALTGEAVVSALAAWGACVSLGGYTPEGVMLVQLVQSLALLAFGIAIMQRMERAGLLDTRVEPLLGTRRVVLLGFLYLGAVNLRLNIVARAIEAFAQVRVPTPPEDPVLTVLPDLSALAQALVALRIVMIVPMAEEVLFRGVILPRLTAWMGAVWAVVATSAIFAVLHEGFTYEAVGVRAAGIFVVAVVLGWARLRAGNLTAPITIHMITNAFALWGNR